jgi:predicted nucleic acid-binding protein
VIILDTDVVSELVRPTPSKVVISWVDQQRSTDLAITAQGHCRNALSLTSTLLSRSQTGTNMQR